MPPPPEDESLRHGRRAVLALATVGAIAFAVLAARAGFLQLGHRPADAQSPPAPGIPTNPNVPPGGAP